MGHAKISMHGVDSITLLTRYKSNGGYRVMRIKSEDGQIIDIGLYGKTGVFEMLPWDKEFEDYDVR